MEQADRIGIRGRFTIRCIAARIGIQPGEVHLLSATDQGIPLACLTRPDEEGNTIVMQSVGQQFAREQVAQRTGSPIGTIGVETHHIDIIAERHGSISLGGCGH